MLGGFEGWSPRSVRILSNRHQHGTRERGIARTGSGPTLTGVVETAHGRACVVVCENGRRYRCSHARRVGQPVCNDRVELQPDGEHRGRISAILPRRNLLDRSDFRGRARPLAANIERLLIVTAPEPEPDLLLVDAYLVLAHRHGLAVTLVLNKADRCPPSGTPAGDRLRSGLDAYLPLGCDRLDVSARTGIGLEPLRQCLQTEVGILVGQSGVGKSSLVNALLPDRAARTGQLSETSGQGRHTTTETTLYRMAPGDHSGGLIDSPGVRILRLGHFDPADIIAGFPELSRWSQDCHYRDCSHRHEPRCRVLEAIAQGLCSPRRLESLQRLLAMAAEPQD